MGTGKISGSSIYQQTEGSSGSFDYQKILERAARIREATIKNGDQRREAREKVEAQKAAQQGTENARSVQSTKALPHYFNEDQVDKLLEPLGDFGKKVWGRSGFGGAPPADFDVSETTKGTLGRKKDGTQPSGAADLQPQTNSQRVRVKDGLPLSPFVKTVFAGAAFAGAVALALSLKGNILPRLLAGAKTSAARTGLMTGLRQSAPLWPLGKAASSLYGKITAPLRAFGARMNGFGGMQFASTAENVSLSRGGMQAARNAITTAERRGGLGRVFNISTSSKNEASTQLNLFGVHSLQSRKVMPGNKDMRLITAEQVNAWRYDRLLAHQEFKTLRREIGRFNPKIFNPHNDELPNIRIIDYIERYCVTRRTSVSQLSKGEFVDAINFVRACNFPNLHEHRILKNYANSLNEAYGRYLENSGRIAHFKGRGQEFIEKTRFRGRITIHS